jgi:hypothetical protein
LYACDVVVLKLFTRHNNIDKLITSRRHVLWNRDVSLASPGAKQGTAVE